MPRPPRFTLAGAPHHVIRRGNNRQEVFFDTDDFARYRHYLHEAAVKSECALHAYVLMPNHVHLLITPAGTSGIPDLMKTLNQRYTSYFNRRHGRSGGLWEGRYRAGVVDSERYFLICERYIELNPVRAGIVGEAGGYKWSSYGANAAGAFDPLLTAHAVYLALGATDAARRGAYLALVADALAVDEEQTVRESGRRGLSLGNAIFRALIADVGGPEPEVPRPGRPRILVD